MITLAQAINELYDAEEDHRKEPSELTRLVIDNRNAQIEHIKYILIRDLQKQGVKYYRIQEILNEEVCSAFKISNNNGERERMSDFYFACERNIKLGLISV